MLVSQLEINMDPIRTLHPLARAWLLDGPLSPLCQYDLLHLPPRDQ